ncbi:MAG: hypothetical protein U5R46_09610 [Gammaproteobacteria bacterium]|nr:hypothetical protein [Gammaproteobacteria bacterium]
MWCILETYERGGIAWLALQILLLSQEGIRYGNDSPRYIEAAEALLAGRLQAGKAISYLGYDAFVALFLGIGLGPPAIIIAQIENDGEAQLITQ